MHGHTLRWTMLLKVRQAVRDQRRQALAEIMKQEQLLTHRLLALDEELIELERSFEGTAAFEPVVAQRRLDTKAFESSLASRRRALKQELSQLLGEVDRHQQALLAAETELKAMENLHAQQVPQAGHQHRLQGASSVRSDAA